MPGSNGSRRNRPGLRYAVTVATDTPFFPPDLVARFLARPSRGAPTLMVARSAEGVHPVIGLWPVSLAPELEAALEAGTRKAGAFTEAHGAVEIDFPPLDIGGRTVDPFFNINRPDDLAEADCLLRDEPP